MTKKEEKNKIEKRKVMKTVEKELDYMNQMKNVSEEQLEEFKETKKTDGITFKELRELLKRYYSERPVLLSSEYLQIFARNHLEFHAVKEAYPGLPILKHTNFGIFNFSLEGVDFVSDLWMELKMIRTCPPKKVTFSYGKDTIGFFPHAVTDGKNVKFCEGAKSFEDLPKSIMEFYKENTKAIEDLYIAKQKQEIFQQIEKTEEQEKDEPIELPLQLWKPSNLTYEVEINLKENRQILYCSLENEKDRSILNRQYLSVENWEETRNKAFDSFYTEMAQLPQSLKWIVSWYRLHPELENLDDYVSCILEDAMVQEEPEEEKEEAKTKKQLWSE